PTVFSASIVPWRWMAPVRARIASSSVVLPLWNGPTSAMHRGPVALVPFCAISASQSTEVRSSARPFAPSFQAGGGLGKRRLRLPHDGGTGDGHAPAASKKRAAGRAAVHASRGARETVGGGGADAVPPRRGQN